eukprot:TRINITY_DN32489_c0_g1_i1.p1 TRINITY_DN32489_c0_g1~~TRINITY_DN32489_c0_g1_i1.p1  ORF type:complete len:266 (+),score=111.46 TRINITY_DN32489_c0_g1_i1:52-798(+)
MEIRVELFDSRIVAVEVQEDWCVSDVAAAACAAADVAPQEVSLMYCGEVLADAVSVLAAGLMPFCVVQMQLSARCLAIEEMRRGEDRAPPSPDALIEAVKAADEKTVALLITAGVDVNTRQAGRYNQATPLHFAARLGLVEIAKLLVAHGADVDALDFFLETPLHDASRGGQYHVALFLVNAGANIDPANNRCCTPLMEAVRRDYVDVAALLLSAGCDRNMVDDQGVTAASSAKTQEMYELFPNKTLE